MCNYEPLPSPFLPRYIDVGKVVFEQIHPHSYHVMTDVFIPIEWGQVKEEDRTIFFIQISPKLLNIVVRENPFIGAEERDDIRKFMDFLVSFQ